MTAWIQVSGLRSGFERMNFMLGRHELNFISLETIFLLKIWKGNFQKSQSIPGVDALELQMQTMNISAGEFSVRNRTELQKVEEQGLA